MKTAILGHAVLDERYVLLECLAVSALGEVYRARDLQLTRTHGAASLVIVHKLPNSMATLAARKVYKHITQTTQQLNKAWILHPSALLQKGESHYIVMQSPPIWGMQSLSCQAEPSRRFHKKLSTQLAPLHQLGYLDTHIDAALLLSQRGYPVYLLATALSTELQAMQNTYTCFRLSNKLPLKVLSFAVMVTLSAALGTGAAAVLSPSLEDKFRLSAPSRADMSSRCHTQEYGPTSQATQADHLETQQAAGCV